MAQRRSFDKNYLKQEFEKLDTETKRSLTLYLITSCQTCDKTTEFPQKEKRGFTEKRKVESSPSVGSPSISPCNGSSSPTPGTTMLNYAKGLRG